MSPLSQKTKEELPQAVLLTQDRGLYPRALGRPERPSAVCVARDSGSRLFGSKDPIDVAAPLPGVPRRSVAKWGRTEKLLDRLYSLPRSKSYLRWEPDAYWEFYAERSFTRWLHLEWNLYDKLLELCVFGLKYGLKTKHSRTVLKETLYTVDFRFGYKAGSVVKPNGKTLKGLISTVLRLLRH